MRVPAYVFGHLDLLTAPPPGLVEGVLDNKSISWCSKRPFIETDLEEFAGLRQWVTPLSQGSV
jgi:hypothetical protein